MNNAKELQKQLEAVRAELDSVRNGFNFAMDQMAKMLEQWQATDVKRAEAERERDEARAEVERLRTVTPKDKP